ncbi:MAG: hypothetical protein C0419_05390 [Microbacterium sp.]|nr:hypothetical protein [Microbacterium sp.]
MTRASVRRFAAMSVALALPLAFLTVAPASAATVGVDTWSEIKAAFLVDGDTVRLDADITAPAGDSLSVQAGESIILDLNGRSLTITNPAMSTAAILVPPTSSLTINASGGGELTATGGPDGAGIGGSAQGAGGTVTINGGTITATGGAFAAGIGGGVGVGQPGGAGGTTTINGGTITATGSVNGAGIGGGGTGSGDGGAGGTTTINGGTITAIGGGAGIGGGGGSGGAGGAGGTTTINGGTITASGFGAGIGSGAGSISPGALQVNGTPDVGAATDGGGPYAAPITNPITPPAGVGYSATTSTLGSADTVELRFNYLITFAANGGSATVPQTINDGDTVSVPATPTREGFTFTGWTSGGSAHDFTAPVTGPLVLTAAWAAMLAATGADVTSAAAVAFLLTAVGVLLFARRRRATAQSA